MTTDGVLTNNARFRYIALWDTTNFEPGEYTAVITAIVDSKKTFGTAEITLGEPPILTLSVP